MIIFDKPVYMPSETSPYVNGGAMPDNILQYGAIGILICIAIVLIYNYTMGERFSIRAQFKKFADRQKKLVAS